MKKFINYGIVIFIIILVVAYFKNKDSLIRFKSELNQFFGEGNWECISEETQKSIIYKEKSTGEYSKNIPGRYTDWLIKFSNKNGKDETYKITNHTLKINHNKYGLFSLKRYSDKQALVLELMQISFELAGNQLLDDIIKEKILPENIANCLSVSISYNGGNPKPKFYDELFKQSWFNVNSISAENFLTCDLYDFYIDIHAYDYKVEKLTEQEQQTLFNSIETLETKLAQMYGRDASFSIYFNKEHNVKYIDGNKQ